MSQEALLAEIEAIGIFSDKNPVAFLCIQYQF